MSNSFTSLYVDLSKLPYEWTASFTLQVSISDDSNHSKCGGQNQTTLELSFGLACPLPFTTTRAIRVKPL
ncbi:hypothetical protein OPQ81_001615 [Rhizoctonia solani]|nr:hypothetical protein OPQ81_001615 [Rhizoctonia solani]